MIDFIKRSFAKENNSDTYKKDYLKLVFNVHDIKNAFEDEMGLKTLEKNGIKLLEKDFQFENLPGRYYVFDVNGEKCTFFIPDISVKNFYLRLEIPTESKYGVSRIIKTLFDEGIIIPIENFDFKDFKVKTLTYKGLKLINVFVHKDLLNEREEYKSPEQFLNRYNKEAFKAFYKLSSSLKNKVKFNRFDYLINGKINLQYVIEIELEKDWRHLHVDYRFKEYYIRGLDFYYQFEYRRALDT